MSQREAKQTTKVPSKIMMSNMCVNHGCKRPISCWDCWVLVLGIVPEFEFAVLITYILKSWEIMLITLDFHKIPWNSSVTDTDCNGKIYCVYLDSLLIYQFNS